jgi:HSP20 family protein
MNTMDRVPLSPGVAAPSGWQPPVDIVESESEIAIRVELAGIKRNQVRVILDGGILSIAGNRERERNDNDQTDQRSERGYEAFRKSFTVPELTVRDKVTAGYRNGMLTVHLPKDPAGQIRSVEIDRE